MSGFSRRRALALFGSAAIGGATAVSTGAFTSTSADRAVNIQTADDSSAFLRLAPISDTGVGGEATGRSVSFGSESEFFIPGEGRGETEADGVGPDSVYEFRNLLRVENQGTQTVEVYSEYSGEAFANLALIDDGGILREDPRAVDVGSVLDVGLYIDTHGSELGEETQTLEIVADQPD
jgi:hypothetical protein